VTAAARALLKSRHGACDEPDLDNRHTQAANPSSKRELAVALPLSVARPRSSSVGGFFPAAGMPPAEPLATAARSRAGCALDKKEEGDADERGDCADARDPADRP
jgi:hypothetical protein